MTAPLLIELLTEELPPKSLRTLADEFASQVQSDLIRRFRLKDDVPLRMRVFATPRRLGALIQDVRDKAEPSEHEVSGPSTSAPKQAVEGFARKHGVAPDDLQRASMPKGEVWIARTTIEGVHLDAVLASVIEGVLKKLPIPKLMRWGSGEAQFVRPVHGLVMLHGDRIVPGRVLGIESGRATHGHRFMGTGGIALAHADEYEGRLESEGCVIADFARRRAMIEQALKLKAEAVHPDANMGEYRDLLDEVTALVEHPSVYVGAFDAAFLDVPPECLILTMRQNQKYFPLFDAQARLLPQFLIVSNMQVGDPRHIIAGNERVVRPRLDDARFFYDQDRRTRLEARVPQLAKMVYHNKLGTQLERVERIQLLAGEIARRLGANAQAAERAAWLAKADLLTGMVGEFPELQGIMGRYYALHDAEPPEVADAIQGHYLPRFAGDALPQGAVACAVALADKLDALAGLFGIGQVPTGDKDPFGLRRAALGILRILAEGSIALPIDALVEAAFKGFDEKIGDARNDLETFIFERARGYLLEQGYTANEVEAVLCLRPARVDLLPRMIEAVRQFSSLPEATSLAAANKRIANILRQAQAKGESYSGPDATALREPAERALQGALQDAIGSAGPLFEAGDFAGYLRTFASLKQPVDVFFDAVMVMADDKRLRENRLALLADMRQAMNRVADISKLAA